MKMHERYKRVVHENEVLTEHMWSDQDEKKGKLRSAVLS